MDKADAWRRAEFQDWRLNHRERERDLLEWGIADTVAQALAGLKEENTKLLNDAAYEADTRIAQAIAQAVAERDAAHGRIMVERDRWIQISRKTMEVLCEIDTDVHIGYDGDEVAYAQAVVAKVAQQAEEIRELRAKVGFMETREDEWRHSDGR